MLSQSGLCLHKQETSSRNDLQRIRWRSRNDSCTLPWARDTRPGWSWLLGTIFWGQCCSLGSALPFVADNSQKRPGVGLCECCSSFSREFRSGKLGIELREAPLSLPSPSRRCPQPCGATSSEVTPGCSRSLRIRRRWSGCGITILRHRRFLLSKETLQLFFSEGNFAYFSSKCLGVSAAPRAVTPPAPGRVSGTAWGGWVCS